jgi:tetratricopeptide (TPR) repeat protein
MPDNPTRDHCPEDRLGTLVAALSANEPNAMHELDALMASYPSDARLHFLKGSLLAGAQDYTAARREMRRAVDLAPDYAVARFQLGLLILTSGEPHAALEAWGPLHALPPDHFLRLFVRGLTHLINDEFSDAISLLAQGVAHNNENPAMNRDMQLVIEEARLKLESAGSDRVTSVDLLLQQAALKASRH